LNRDSYDHVFRLGSAIEDQAAQPYLRSTIDFEFSKIGIQPKLKVSQPKDEYEQEADRIAEHAIKMPSTSDLATPIEASKDKEINRKCAACGMEEEDEAMKISREASNASSTEIADEVTSAISNIRLTVVLHLILIPRNSWTRD
jgi:hypothetical protein